MVFVTFDLIAPGVRGSNKKIDKRDIGKNLDKVRNGEKAWMKM